MRPAILIGLLLLCGVLRAQGPVIDSMHVDEWNRTLEIHGQFSFAKGAVWVDSMELPITSWSDTLIRATIPDSGRGSAGPVVVGAKGYQSGARMLTLLRADASFLTFNTQPGLKEIFSFSVRTDIHSAILNKKDYIYNLELRHFSRLVTSYSGGEYYGKGTGYEIKIFSAPLQYFPTDSTTNFKAAITLSLRNRTLRIDITDVPSQPAIRNDYVNSLNTSSTWVPISIPDFSLFTSLNSLYSLNLNDTITSSSCLFPPSDSTVALANGIILLSPLRNSIINRDGIMLVWNPLKYTSRYIMQLSSDSAFSKIAIQQFTTESRYVLPTLDSNTTYYWRVAGVNEEGQSRWSDVWKFTTNSLLKVADHNIGEEITLAPNPAYNYITISFGDRAASVVSITITNILGNTMLNQNIDHTSSPLSLPLPFSAGTYICRLQTNEGIVVRKLIIQ